MTREQWCELLLTMPPTESACLPLTPAQRVELAELLGCIPDLERQLADAKRMALTDAELATFAHIVDCTERCALHPGSSNHCRLKAIVARLAPQPIDWHTIGDGAFASHNGWTLAVLPDLRGGTNEQVWHWSVGKVGVACDDDSCGDEPTLEEAKAAAEAWVREGR